MNKINQPGIAPFDASDYLDSEETVVDWQPAKKELRERFE